MGESVALRYSCVLSTGALMSQLLEHFFVQDAPAGLVPTPPPSPPPQATDKSQENGNLPFEPNHNHIVQVCAGTSDRLY